MFNGRDVVYCYDGSFDGLLCCVFESFVRRETPVRITAGAQEQLTLAEVLDVPTDPEKAARVAAAIPKKISPRTEELVKIAFLTFGEDKDLLILKYLQKGFAVGGRIEDMLADDTVNALYRAIQHCTVEAQRMKQFIRFSDFDGYLAAVIEPKNKVIPLIADHFTDRYRNENFLIYDETHRMALVYHSHRAEIAENIYFEMPAASAEEEHYRELWKSFYDAIAIKERYNPRCRMNMMPKRYWKHMTEFSENEFAKKKSGTETIGVKPSLPRN
ncbi:MAG: TIGR03915 family putative DNA repair protein [Oscillospiraceae bacterium]|nr:TIGR03915 family putative DNA repair protein [Oscillospiraceae bacterium]